MKAYKYTSGDSVEKTKGDYRYRGTVVAVFTKLNGAVRYVVENNDGMLFIFNEDQLHDCESIRDWGRYG